jgi:hypothetical protein
MKRIPLAISIILLLCVYANAQSQVDRGVVQDGEYSNPGFGFTFKFPKDWVVHGEATNERIRELGKEKVAESGGASKASVDVAMKNTYQLLTIFRHPLGTPGVAFNPAILVIAERVAYAPGITSGKDYLLNVRALLMKAGYQVLLKEPVEYRFAGSEFFRDNYAVDVNGVQMVQAHFVTLRNGYALIFAFMGEDQTSVDEMAKAMETFELIPPVRRGVTTLSSPPQPPKPKP